MEPSESMSEVWTRWQGHVINGMFPLGGFLGSSDHSGVFLTKCAALSPPEAAIKLVPTNRALAELLLPRWKRAGGLTHPHLLRLLQSGGCQLDGLPYLYGVMEYAHQTLAQLLQRRALTEDEAREMLLPILDALAFLHSHNLVQGQLKPTNILVVGDQLKLASDTLRRVSEGTASTNKPTPYDAPETHHVGSSAAGDIWALGVTLYEALTRRLPSGLGESGEAVVLPADFSPAFRDVVARCLRPDPQDRPGVTELVAWARGRSAEFSPAATIRPAAVVPPEPPTPEPAPPRTPPPQVAPDARPAPSMPWSSKRQALLTAALGGVVILALGWTGLRMFRIHPPSAPPPPPAQASAGSPAAGAATPATAGQQAPGAAVSTTQPTRSDGAAPPLALHEVIPDVPRGARGTIRGHIKVWVRVIVDQDGSVFAAVADRTGPSRYFQRLAVDAAKKWTFPPVDTPARRLMQVRFEFSRDGVTGRAVTLH